jgi:hypothetical protein
MFTFQQENILVDDAGRCMIGGFTMSASFAIGRVWRLLTSTIYAAPEWIEIDAADETKLVPVKEYASTLDSEGNKNFWLIKADCYSVGCIIYEVICFPSRLRSTASMTHIEI